MNDSNGLHHHHHKEHQLCLRNSNSSQRFTRSAFTKNTHQLTLSPPQTTPTSDGGLLDPLYLSSVTLPLKRPALTANLNLGNTAKKLKVYSPSVMEYDGEEVKRQQQPWGGGYGHKDQHHGTPMVVKATTAKSGSSKKKKQIANNIQASLAVGGVEGGVGGARGGVMELVSSTSPQSTIVLDPGTQQKLISALTSPKGLARLADVNFFVTIKEQLKSQVTKAGGMGGGAEKVHRNENSVQVRDRLSPNETSLTGNSGNGTFPRVATPIVVGGVSNHKQIERHPLISFADNARDKIGAVLGHLPGGESPSPRKGTPLLVPVYEQARCSLPTALANVQNNKQVTSGLSAPCNDVLPKESPSSPPMSEREGDSASKVICVEVHTPDVGGVASHLEHLRQEHNVAFDSVSKQKSGNDSCVVTETCAMSEERDKPFSNKSLEYPHFSSLIRRPLYPATVAESKSSLDLKSHTSNSSHSPPPHPSMSYLHSPLAGNVLKHADSGCPLNTSLPLPSAKGFVLGEEKVSVCEGKDGVHDRGELVGGARSSVVKKKPWSKKKKKMTKKRKKRAVTFDTFSEGVTDHHFYDDSDEGMEIESLVPIIDRSIIDGGLDSEAHSHNTETDSSSTHTGEQNGGKESNHIPLPQRNGNISMDMIPDETKLAKVNSPTLVPKNEEESTSGFNTHSKEAVTSPRSSHGRLDIDDGPLSTAGLGKNHSPSLERFTDNTSAPNETTPITDNATPTLKEVTPITGEDAPNKQFGQPPSPPDDACKFKVCENDKSTETSHYVSHPVATPLPVENADSVDTDSSRADGGFQEHACSETEEQTVDIEEGRSSQEEKVKGCSLSRKEEKVKGHSISEDYQHSESDWIEDIDNERGSTQSPHVVDEEGGNQRDPPHFTDEDNERGLTKYPHKEGRYVPVHNERSSSHFSHLNKDEPNQWGTLPSGNKDDICDERNDASSPLPDGVEDKDNERGTDQYPPLLNKSKDHNQTPTNAEENNQSMESTNTHVPHSADSAKLRPSSPEHLVEPSAVDVPHIDLTVGGCDRDDCSSSSTSGIITASARFRKEWSVANSDSQSTGLFSRSSSCNLSDSFNSSDRFSLADSCRSFSEGTPENVAESKTERPSSFPNLLPLSWRQKRGSDTGLLASTKMIMTRSKLADLKKIGDREIVSLISPDLESSSSSDGSMSPAEYSVGKRSHKNGRSLSVSSLESGSSSSSGTSLRGDTSGNSVEESR